MNESNGRQPSRKRAANNIFQRALFGLNKNESPPKRARLVTDNSLSPPSSNPLSRTTPGTNRPSSSREFTSFSNASPNRNFMHDRRRSAEDHSKSIRHTPETRLFGKRQQRGGKSINITTRTRRKQQGLQSDGHYNPFVDGARNRNGHGPHHHSKYQHQHNRRGKKRKQKQSDYNSAQQQKYQYVELCRHRKLWTDLVGDHERLISELVFCRDTSYFITSNSIAHKISNIIRILLNEYGTHGNLDETPLSILDGLSCIGGNTYSFAKVFASPNHQIYGNELDEDRFDALKHNMKVFADNGLIAGGDRVQLFNLDFLTLHESLGGDRCDAMDVVFLDPEWNNGSDYKQTNRGQIHLFNIGPLHLYQTVDRIIMEWYRNVKVVAVKVAKNWDQEFIVRKLQKCKLIESKCFRIGLVSFHNQKLVLIAREFGSGGKEDDDEDEDVDIAEEDEKVECTKGFEQVLAQLPALTNPTGSSNLRDCISVEVLW